MEVIFCFVPSAQTSGSVCDYQVLAEAGGISPSRALTHCWLLQVTDRVSSESTVTVGLCLFLLFGWQGK